MGSDIKLIIDDLNDKLKCWSVEGFVDHAFTAGEVVHDLPVLGDDELLTNFGEPVDVVIAVGSVLARERIYEKLSRNSFINFPTLIHPNAYVACNAVLDEGVIVSQFCVVSACAHISRCVNMNAGAVVGHHAKIGPFTMVMSHAGIMGSVNVGKNVLIGANSVVMQGLDVGDNAVVGMGCVVTVDVRGGSTVFGNPAKTFPRLKK
jgi:sugar O-acyltransferase (sialic acid O-acetyltransferase NeuD family)